MVKPQDYIDSVAEYSGVSKDLVRQVIRAIRLMIMQTVINGDSLKVCKGVIIRGQKRTTNDFVMPGGGIIHKEDTYIPKVRFTNDFKNAIYDAQVSGEYSSLEDEDDEEW